MRLFLLVFLLLAVVAVRADTPRPYILVLGVGQDAGVPQMGCDSPFCRRARKDKTLRQTVSSIALVDPAAKSRWIFDATPDLPEQFELLKTVTRDRSNNLAGIFLTHAHIGHYTGLMYLGRESMNTRELPVFAMPRMKRMLGENAPWSQLVALNNIIVKPLADNRAIALGTRLTVEPFLVPHRDELSETVGYRIKSDKKTAVYIPDIDKWEKWSTSLDTLVRASDYLLLDGTFYADGEISRPMREVPHPFVSETMQLLSSLPARERTKVYFIHFNHSNPLVQGNAAKIREVRAKGFRVATHSLKLHL